MNDVMEGLSYHILRFDLDFGARERQIWRSLERDIERKIHRVRESMGDLAPEDYGAPV